MGSKASALGWAPKRSAGLGFAQIVSTTASVRVSITLRVSLAAFAQTTWRPSGDTARALAWSPVTISARAFPDSRSITVTEPSLATCFTGSTLTSVPRPAGPVSSPGRGRRPPQFDT